MPPNLGRCIASTSLLKGSRKHQRSSGNDRSATGRGAEERGSRSGGTRLPERRHEARPRPGAGTRESEARAALSSRRSCSTARHWNEIKMPILTARINSRAPRRGRGMSRRTERGHLRAAGGAPSGSIRGRGGDPASGGHVSPLLGAWGPVSGRGSQLRGTGGALAVCGRTAEAAPCGSSETEPLVRQVCPLGSCSARAPWSERCRQPGRAPRHPGLRGDRW